MTSTQTYSPAPAAPAPAPRQGNGFGITALILGICAFVLGMIPFVGFASWFLGLLAVIFGGIGLTRKFRPKRSSIAGLVIGAISIITSLAFAFMYTASFAAAVSSSIESAGTAAGSSSAESADTDAASASDDSADTAVATGQHTVVYKVTGTGKATVSYHSMKGSNSFSKSGTVALPYKKTLKFTKSGDVFDFNLFSVTAISKSMSESAKATCTLTVDGKVKATDSATGPFAMVSCVG
jgi:hypothetical protein